MAQRHPRRGAGGAGSGGVAETRPGSAGAVGKMNPTCGVHASVRGEREGADDGRHEAKKKIVIPHSEKEGTKPPYVCPGCSNHTHGNNMINRCNVIK
jgi:hypothetical protein